MSDFWDNRDSTEEFVYGTEPNVFFKSEIDKLPPGRLLTLGEGEGRNGVYAASLGWKVDAVDFSRVAKEKALRLARNKDTMLNYIVEDLEYYLPPIESYDVVALIYVHLGTLLSKIVHKRTFRALKSGGRIIFEAYAKEQLGRSSGGPQDITMLYSIAGVRRNFRGMKIITLKKEVIQLNEGKFTGEAVIIRFVGEK